MKITNLNIKYLLVNGNLKGNDEDIAEKYYQSKGFSILRNPFRNNKSRYILTKFFSKEIITKLSKKINGSPDLLIYKELDNKFKYCFIECKSENFQLSKHQFEFLKKLQDNKLKFLVFKIMEVKYNKASKRLKVPIKT